MINIEPCRVKPQPHAQRVEIPVCCHSVVASDDVHVFSESCPRLITQRVRHCGQCFFKFRQLRRISWRRLSCYSLVHVFVASRVDYCGSLLIGTPTKTTDKLQRVLKWRSHCGRLRHVTAVDCRNMSSTAVDRDGTCELRRRSQKLALSTPSTAIACLQC